MLGYGGPASPPNDISAEPSEHEEAVRPGRSLEGLRWEKRLSGVYGKSQEERHCVATTVLRPGWPPAAENYTLFENSSGSIGHGDLGETEPWATGHQVTVPPRSDPHEACQTHQVLRWGQRARVQAARPPLHLSLLHQHICLCSHHDRAGGRVLMTRRSGKRPNVAHREVSVAHGHKPKMDHSCTGAPTGGPDGSGGEAPNGQSSGPCIWSSPLCGKKSGPRSGTHGIRGRGRRRGWWSGARGRETGRPAQGSPERGAWMDCGSSSRWGGLWTTYELRDPERGPLPVELCQASAVPATALQDRDSRSFPKQVSTPVRVHWCPFQSPCLRM